MIHLRKLLPFAILSCLLLGTATNAMPQEQLPIPEWQIDGQESQITFHGTQLGVTFKGTFHKFVGTINHNPDDLSQTAITLDIALANAMTGNLQRDNTLPTPDWFDSLTNPIASFNSTSLKHLEGDKHTLEGTFTLKNITKSLSFPLILTIDEKGTAHATGEFSLNRLDFKVGMGDWSNPDWVGIQVKVKFNITASKK
jgi:cytochrome b561